MFANAMSRTALGGVVLLTVLPAAHAQWVEFNDETAQRLVASANRGSANPDEKDYAWGDVDHDGDIDLVAVYKSVATTAGRRQNVLFMNEGGVLVDRTADYATMALVQLEGGATSLGFDDTTNDRDVALADLNGDGWLDIITATTLSGGTGGTVGDKAISHPRIYINLGDAPPGSGNWMGFVYDDVDRVPTMAAEPRFCAVSAGDIDDDGDLDLYFGDYQQGPYVRAADLNDRLWINDGTGYFTDQSSLRMTFEMTESSFGMATAIVDMNGDGTLDIVKDDALSAPTAVSISYNDPDNVGFFNAYETVYNFSPYHISVGDLNNDDWPDIVVTDDGTDSYILNQGPGANGMADFGPRINLLGAAAGQFGGNSFIADFNNDGFNDVFITNMDVDAPSCNTQSKIYRNLGNLPNVSLQHSTNAGISQQDMDGLHDVAVFDLNGDGWLDVVLGMCEGTRVYINEPPTGLLFSYPQGLPSFAMPEEAVEVEFVVAGIDGGVPVDGSAMLHLSINDGPFATLPVETLGANHYRATLPSGVCIDRYRYYLSAGEAVSAATQTDPPSAPAVTYDIVFAVGTQVAYQDDFELDVSDWTVVSDPSLASGEWERAAPIGALHNGIVATPPADAEAADSQILAFITEQGIAGRPARSSDIDGGPTHLISPLIDLDGTDARISYFRWFYTAEGIPDTFVVSISNNDGADWTPVETLFASTTGWEDHAFTVSDFVTPTASVRVRFTASDQPSNSVTDAGVDLFRVEAFSCTPCIKTGCDDGLFCNGVESCDGVSCQESVNPCAGPCDEGSDACVACIVSAHCDDGVYCNGQETCDAFGCLPGTNPCTSKGLTCDEATADCIGCIDNAMCDDGLFCNGAEWCFEAGCIPGTTPCEDNEFCDESADACVTGCGSDAECDDGQYCNGVESCSAGQCVAGLPPCAAQTPCVESSASCTPTLQPRLGDPLVALTPAELERFTTGRALFNTVLTVEDGLGPIFNQNSCAICHSNPIGGSGSTQVTRFGFQSEDGFDPLDDLGGSLLQALSTDAECAETVPAEANVETTRATPSTLGFGLVEAIAAKDITDRTVNPPAGISGTAHFVSALEDAPGAPLRVGRFGWKAQVPTLLTFSGDAALNEMGLTNRLVPAENAPNGDLDLLAGCDTVPDPEDDGAVGAAFIDQVTDFQRFTAPPPQTPRGGTTGATLFTAIGCADCHVPVYRTSGAPELESALRDQRLNPYSDFLLHDMGFNGDPIVQGDAGIGEVRTTPLWGVRVRDPLWHDGRIGGGTFAARIGEAIALHGAPGSEGAAAAAGFAALSAEQQQWVVAFLDSLGRAEFDYDGDNRVDLTDAAALRGCFGSTPTPDDACAIGDFDRNQLVDGDDAAWFIAAFDGNICDCDGNGTADLIEIVSGAVPDSNLDGIPDGCAIYGDVDASLHVNLDDVLCLLDGFAGHPGAGCLPERMDLAPCAFGDGLIDLSDIVAALDVFAQASDCGCTP